MMRMARPAHPGQFIRMEVIGPLGLSVTEAAKVLGVTRPALSALVGPGRSLTRHGAAGGEGFWRQDGHPASDADRVRDCRGS